MKRWLAALMLALAGAVPAQAADFELQNTMEDALYGGAIGALVGAGAMLVSGSPSKHWDYLLTGAGLGIIGGAIYGVYTSARPVAELEDGKLKLAVPTPEPALDSGGRLAMRLPLFASRF